MKHINRNVLLIRPTQAMLDWVNSLEPEHGKLVLDVADHDQSNIYLIKETGTIAERLKWLRKNFRDIFAEELFIWWTDESEWPEMSWRNFEAFCYNRTHTCVYDTQRGGIRYD